MAKATVTTSVISPISVKIQTLRGTQGTAAAVTAVEAAVKTFNAQQPKGSVAHTVETFEAVAPNTKGMQWQLAVLATVARCHEVTMIRLNVHNGMVALCGPKTSIEAVRKATIDTRNIYATLVSSAYNPATDGNRVGFINGYLCGLPAGMQIASKVTPTLAYGLGFLFDFPAPGSGVAYLRGQVDGAKAYVPFVAKAPRAAKPVALKPVASATVEAEEVAVA